MYLYSLMHACTHARTHARARTHTHIKKKHKKPRRRRGYNFSFQAGANLPSEIMAYLATEDIYALGYALAETIFTTLAHKEVRAKKDTTPPLMKQWLREV